MSIAAVRWRLIAFVAEFFKSRFFLSRLLMSEDDFESMNYGFISTVPDAALPPTWTCKDARELIEALEGLLECRQSGEVRMSLHERACVADTRARLRDRDPRLVPEFDLRVDQVWSAYLDVRIVEDEEPWNGDECRQSFHDHVRGFIAWLGQPASAPVYPENHLSSPVQASAQGSVCPVVLQGQGKPVLVRSKEVAALGPRQYRTVEIMVKRFPIATPLGIFSQRDILDAPKVLKSIDKLPGWDKVIQFPGGKGKGGYVLIA